MEKAVSVKRKKQKMQKNPKFQRYQRKILLLRIERLILLAIIMVLLLGNTKTSARTELAAGNAIEAISAELAGGGKGSDHAQGAGIQVENGQLSNGNVNGRWLGENVLQQESVDIQTEYKWLQTHKSLFPKNKVESAEGNAELIHFLYAYGTGTYTVPEQRSLTKEEMAQEIPLFMQWDARWGYDAYGDSNIGICGCAPTCLAMVAVGLTRDESFTPAMVAAYATKKDYYLAGTGTKWALFDGFAGDYGFICRTVGTSKSAILAELKKGNPVICSMAAGTFTQGGHFIVLCSEKDGKVLVNDPNNVEFSNKEWDIAEFADEIKHAWVLEKGEKR